jgi:two-component system sensor histidine kinase GlrK
MKVSSKIISGFLILMLLAVSGLVYEWRVIARMQNINDAISGVSMSSATIALTMRDIVQNSMEPETEKYFSGLAPIYADLVTRDHADLLQQLDEVREIQKKGGTDQERAETENMARALDEYWDKFIRLKEQKRSFQRDELPPDISLAMNHLSHQTEVMLDATKTSIRDQAVNASEIGRQAVRISLIAGATSLVLSLIVAVVIVRSIKNRLRRLTHGTRAIAKGQFWHRLPTHGRDEFTELARDFNEMSEKLGELDGMKKDFVSHVSHDLKAPLASIRQIMHLLLQEIPGTLNEQQKSLIQLSYNSAERLAAMVGNLLDLSRMEAGSMEYQIATHDLLPMLNSAVDEFDIQAREKRIRLRVECDQPSVAVKCDRDRIVQVIGNLFENALKFSPPDSEITARAAAGKPGEVVVSVIDRGPGVPAGHRDKIFHKFHQVKQGKKVAGQGVGLGLAICKTIIEAHQGQLWFEDNPNGGSVFSFALQAAGVNEEVVKCSQIASA